MIALAPHYSRFRVADRLLLTGHSHQAWPDVAFAAQQQAWLDAAEYVDGKWEKAGEQAQLVRSGFARLLGTVPDEIALGQNTHELVVRWLSTLPLRDRPRLVTTDHEFHSLRRQLDRLAEERIDVVRIEARPVSTLTARIASAVNDRVAAVLVSSVLFDTAEIVPDLEAVAGACLRTGTRLLIDAYHHLNVVPFDLHRMGLSHAFVTGGGYKYCQLGEGNAFLRVPAGEDLRPVVTGWFAEFAARHEAGGRRVAYPPGAAAFAGATYDPTSHYRAAAVFDFHRRLGLTAERLRAISQRQIAILESRFESLDVNPARARILPIAHGMRGGFLAIHADEAARLAASSRQHGLWCDARGDLLRLGPAPYLRDDQLTAAIDVLAATLRR